MILPAFNEEETLARAVGDIDRGLHDRLARPPSGDPASRHLAAGGPAPGGFEILVVENGSTDGTRLVLDDLEAAHGAVRSIRLPVADYGAALRAGLLGARGSAWAVFNVDYYDLSFLDTALRLIDAPVGDAPVGDGPAARLVLATKRGRGAHDERGWVRRFATDAFTRLTHVLLGVRASDTHGMKVGSAAALRPLVERCTSTADLFDTELVARTERAGLPIAEIPVTVAETRPPRTSLARRVPRTLTGLVRLRRTLDRERKRAKVRLP